MADYDITARYNVDISNLKKNITEANSILKSNTSELKKVNSEMELNGKSAESMRKAVDILKGSVDAENEKLNVYEERLKQANKYQKEASDKVAELKGKLQELANQGFSDTSDEVKEYQEQLDVAEANSKDLNKIADDLKNTINQQTTKVNKATSELNKMESQLENSESASGKLNTTIKDQQDKLNDLKEKYKNVVLEQGKNSDSAQELADEIRNLNDELKANQDKMDEASYSAEELDDSLDSIDADTPTEGFTVMKGALANLVADGFRKAIEAAKEFASSMIDVAAEVKAQNSQFEQTFGDMADEATEAIDRVATSTGILDTRLKTTGTSIYAFAKASGADSAEAMELMETALTATADGAAYYDRSLEDTAESLQSFLKGNYENDAALGLSATETTRNAAAMELFGQKFNDLSEVQKQQTLLQMVVDAQKLSGAAGQASREMDGWENVQGNLNESWRQFKAMVGTPFLEAIIPVIQEVTESFQEWQDGVDWDAFNEKIGEIADAVKEAFGWILDNKDVIIAAMSGIIGAFVASKIISFGTAVGGAITTIITMAKGIKAATTAQGVWNAIMAANPIGLVVTAIGALIAIIVLLVQNWDTVKEVGVACWDAIKGAWEVASSWFKENIIDPIAKFFSKMWEDVTGFFSKAWDKIVSIWSKVSEWFNENVIEPIKKFFSPLIEFFSTLFGTVYENAKTIFNNLVIIFKFVWDQIVEIFTPIVQWFKDTFTSVYNKIKEVFEPIVTWFSDKFEAAWNGIKKIWDSVSGYFEDKWTSIKDTFSSIGTWFSEKFGDAWTKIKEVFEPVGEYFGGIWETIKEKFTDIGQKVGDSIGGAFKTAINAVLSAAETVLNAPINAINKLIDNLKSVPGFGDLGRLSTFSLPRLAKGGVLSKGARAVIAGEDGAEAIVPLERNKYWIKSVAEDMLGQLQSNPISAMPSMVGSGTSNSFTQIINAPKSPSRIELYRDAKNLLAFGR